jgi:hypothetical protein
MFKFTVSCKNVGFMMRKLRSFSCKLFAIYFFLWGGGGLIGKESLISGLLNMRQNGI